MNCRKCRNNISTDKDKWVCSFDTGQTHSFECYLKHIFMKLAMMELIFSANAKAYQESMNEYRKTNKTIQDDIERGEEWKDE